MIKVSSTDCTNKSMPHKLKSWGFQFLCLRHRYNLSLSTLSRMTGYSMQELDALERGVDVKCKICVSVFNIFNRLDPGFPLLQRTAWKIILDGKDDVSARSPTKTKPLKKQEPCSE